MRRALVTAVVFLVLAPAASAQPVQRVPTHPQCVTSTAVVFCSIVEYRTADRTLRARKCLPGRKYQWSAQEVPLGYRPWVAILSKTQLIQAMFAGRHRCKPSPDNEEAVIRHIFPDATEDAAVKVADCESGLYRYAKNPRSTASGLWQLLRLHWAGRFNPFDPYASSYYVLRITDGGKNWGPWYPSYSCHHQS